MTVRTFLGIPVDGDITVSRRTPQRTPEEFAPILQAVLNDPLFHECGWQQHTPFFNDGEPCVFSAGGFWIRTIHDVTPAPKKNSDHLARLDELLAADVLTQAEYDAAVDRLPEDEDDEDEDDDEVEEDRFSIDYNTHPTLGGMQGYGPARHYVGERQEEWCRAGALSDAIDDSTFDDVLLAAFGDHARVTVRRDGISVESYTDHD